MQLIPLLRRTLLLLAIAIPSTAMPTATRADNGSLVYRANQSLTDAMQFIGIPADQHDRYRPLIKGQLPTSKETAFIDELIGVNTERSVTRFLKLIGKSSVAELKAHIGNDEMVKRVIDAIETASYLGASAGTRYFVTVTPLTEAEKSAYASRPGMTFDPMPTATITFYYFSAPQKRLIGTRFEIAPKAGGIALVLPSFKPMR